MDTEIMIKVLESVDNMVTKHNEINKRLVAAVVLVAIFLCATMTITAGFYFIGQGYPDQTQTVSDTEIKQEIKK